MAIASIRDLLEAGVHFGARTSSWHPAMAPYIYGKRSGVHIIDLRETLRGLIRAYKFLESLTAQGQRVVFVGTKRQAQEIVRAEAQRCGQFFVAQRWLGGTLTNLRTVRERVTRLQELEELEESGRIEQFSKKMISAINREKRKISRNFEGIRDMTELPGALVLVDPKDERIALAEAVKLNIPTLALADTDCDPEPLDFVIPGNDESHRAIQTIVQVLADACEAGRAKASQQAMLKARAGQAAAGPAQDISPDVGAVSYGREG